MSRCRQCDVEIEAGNVLCPACASTTDAVSSVSQPDPTLTVARTCEACGSSSSTLESQYCAACGAKLPELKASDLLPLIHQLQGLKQGSYSRDLPQTNLLSPDFLTRAFAVYGHALVAGLLIGLPLYVIILLISLG